MVVNFKEMNILVLLQLFFVGFIILPQTNGQFINVFGKQELQANSTRVVIVGAGVSGIAAATKLVKAGFQNVLILEADNQIGGRIHTVPFGANVIDVGAQWCHGEKDNAVYNLAIPYHPFGSTSSKYSEFNCVLSNGTKIPQAIADRLTYIAQKVEDDGKTELIGYKKSYGDYMHEKYEKALNRPENHDIDPVISAEFLQFYKKYVKSLQASDSLFDVSAENCLEYHDCEGDRLLNWKGKGYVTILKILQGTYPDENKPSLLENKIYFGKKVNQINWNQLTGSGNVLLKCADGSEYVADHVISTVSLGVLKEKYSTLFNPPLPLKKQRSIQGLAFGTVNKIYLEFSTPFWEKNWNGFGLLWTPNDLREIQNQQNDWIKDIFAILAVDDQPNILCAWISGPNARRMEKRTDEEVTDGVLFLMRKFLQKDVPRPINMLRSKWSSNSNVRGSYSYRSMLTEKLNTSAANLAAPLNKPNTKIPTLLFAGEATHDHYFSTVHGAIESGWREAGRLIELYKKKF